MEAHFQMSAREFAGCVEAAVDEASARALPSNFLLRWAVGPAAVVFVIGASLNWSEDRLIHGISWPIMLVCGVLIIWIFYRHHSRVLDSMVTDGGLLTQPTTIEIGPEHLVLSNRLGRTELLWTAIRQIEETEEHLAIYIDNIVVFFVPKRAFSTEAEFRAFLEKARRWAAAASGPWARSGSDL